MSVALLCVAAVALDALLGEQVTYLSGFSKTLSANLRVSFVVAPPQLAAELTHMKLMCGGITSEMLEQVGHLLYACQSHQPRRRFGVQVAIEVVFDN